MKHYLFEDYASGEEFIVGADNVEEAKALADDLFAEPALIDRISEEEAEASGLDEY